MTTKHTPGPWGYHVTVDGDAIVAGGGKIRVAEALVRDVSHEDERANARLIAAAPDLLAALEALARSFSAVAYAAWTPEMHAAVAAIAKAKGETA
jgi:hypothetical protein